jgi:hypothetical protein
MKNDESRILYFISLFAASWIIVGSSPPPPLPPLTTSNPPCCYINRHSLLLQYFLALICFSRFVA